MSLRTFSFQKSGISNFLIFSFLLLGLVFVLTPQVAQARACVCFNDSTAEVEGAIGSTADGVGAACTACTAHCTSVGSRPRTIDINSFGDVCVRADAPTGGRVEAVTGITEPTEPVLSTSDACGPSGEFLSYICSGATTVLQWIVQLLGMLVTLLLTVLLAFAKYNGFASASVVEVGWPIVRDVCNMFFIIILLISAFSTIIDYGGGELHYTKVLPKLLLMAVLINFSKTLIQLLIDFSQVVMLTFVNAFASAAQGNFVNALGLTEIMQLSSNAAPGTANGTNIIVSYMLAIFMLGIMISVVTIMTAFLIFRIVGLWIALILSPLAFFATAVPGKLAKGLGSLSTDYWSRLGSLLSGGPIIAFFLWLTLAVVQGANASGGGLSEALSFDVPEGAATFLTSIGNAQSIASFIVGITLLMMGLDQAVKSADSIGNTMLSSFAKKAKGAGMSIGRLGALAPFLAAGYGARAVDKRYDVTRSASALGLKTVGRIPGVGAAIRPTLARGLTMRREEAAGQAAQEAKLLGNVAKFGTDQEQKMVGKTYSMSDSKFRTLGDKAGSMKVAEILSTDKIRDREIKKNEERYVKDLQKSGMSEADAKNGSKVLSEKDAHREQMGFIQKQLKLANSLGDLDKVEDLKKAMRQNPYMASDADRQSEIEKLATDPEKYKDIGKQDAMSGDLLTGFMQKHGWETDSKSGELKMKDSAAYDRLKESVQKSGNKPLLEGLEAHEMFVINSPGLKTDEATQLQHRKNSADGLMQTFNVSSDSTGAWSKDGAGNLTSGTRVRTKNYKQASSDVDAMAASRKNGVSPAPALMTSAASSFLDNNGSLADYFKQAKTDEKDIVPVASLSGKVETDVFTGFSALNAGDSKNANTDLKTSSKVLIQLDQQGVSDKEQVPILAAMASGMRDSSTQQINAQVIRKIDQLIPEVRDAIIKSMEVTKKRADDILRNGVKNLQEQAVVDLSDAISKEIDSGKKNINSRILNAYRPGRDRQGGNP